MKRIVYIILLNFFILFPSIRFFVKFLNIYVFIVFIIVFNFILFLMSKDFVKKILSYSIWQIGLIFLTISNYFIYPIVDARKNKVNSGSTGDDAMILAAKSLRKTGKLYDVMINDYTPISPGPGWVIVNSPFTFFDLYFLFTPIYLFISLIVIKKYYGNFSTNLFLLYTFITAVVLELFYNGHDILPFSLSFLIISILIYNTLICKTSILKSVLLGMLLGVIATSRITFIFTPLLFYFLLRKYNKINALFLFLSSLIVFLGFNVYYYTINQNYQPLHLINKANGLLSNPIILALLTFLLVLLYLLKHKFLFFYHNIDWYMKIGLVFSIVLLPLAIGDLLRLNFNFKLWEGANYFVPILPFFIISYINISLKQLQNIKTIINIKS